MFQFPSLLPILVLTTQFQSPASPCSLATALHSPTLTRTQQPVPLPSSSPEAVLVSQIQPYFRVTASNHLLFLPPVSLHPSVHSSPPANICRRENLLHGNLYSPPRHGSLQSNFSRFTSCQKCPNIRASLLPAAFNSQVQPISNDPTFPGCSGIQLSV